MTDDQRILFDSLSKPTLSLSMQEDDIDKKMQEEERDGWTWGEKNRPNVLRLRDAYSNLKRRGCQTTLDQNLVLDYERNRERVEMMFRKK